VQNLSTELADWSQRQLCWEVTEKLDGSSMTVYYRDGEVGVCSRNLELRDTESNTLWQVAHREGIVSCLLDLRFNVAVQGELIGEGIQGNPYRLRGQSFRVFDVYLIDQGRYMLPQERQDWCELNELQTVPVLMHTLTDTGTTVEGLLVSAEGASELNERAEREGLVFKCMSENLSFKAISNRFLLKGGN
jgi:RNA ligase (TIGR02306 family)